MTAIDELPAGSASDSSDGATAVSTPAAVVAAPPVVTPPAEAPVAVAPAEVPTGPTSAELAEAQTPIEPDAPRDEVERIEPEPTGPITLANGMTVEIVPLKLRETMKLLKIVTRGAGSVLESFMGELNMDDPAAFAQTFGALIIMSIPEAENEAVEFINSMVLPVDFDQMPQQQKIDSLQALAEELVNPELDDVISIVERVVRRESEDIRNLGKRISTAFQMTRRVSKS